MKKLQFLSIIFLAFGFFSCVEEKLNPKITIEAEDEKAKFGKTIKISPLDESVQITKSKIIISPVSEEQEYTISGYFNGQIISKTKNTVLRLNNAYLENRTGKSVLQLGAKTEISAAKDSTNYIVSQGRSFEKTGAIHSDRDLILGGSGTLYVKGRIAHAVEAEDVKIKGNGIFYLEGTRKGSAITCDTLTVEAEKSFSTYFLNSKNGIKADTTIKINSGNFHFYNNVTALKTEVSSKSSKRTRSITLSGGKFFFFENETLYATEEGAFSANGAELIDETEK